jgi:WD40 repeat protein
MASEEGFGHLSHWGIPLLQTLKGNWGNVWSVAYSRDGTKLASGSGDAIVRVWDVNAAKAK